MPDAASAEEEFFITHDVHRAMLACPGLALYRGDLINLRAIADADGTTQIFFSVAAQPTHLPKLIAGPAGASCHWQVFDEANSMSLGAAACHSICDGGRHDAGEWETIALPREVARGV